MILHAYYDHDARVQRYANALVNAGAAVDVLALRNPDHVDAAAFRPVRSFTIPLSRNPDRAGGYLAEYVLAVIMFTWALLRLHIRNRYHVIHVHNMPDFLILCAIIPRLLGARLVLDIHDPTPEFYVSKFGRRPDAPLVRFFRLQERLSARLAHAVITANDNFKRKLIARGIRANKITVFNNLPDPVIFNREAHVRKWRRTPDDAFTLIYPGTIAPRYGLDIAIRAVAQLKDEQPPVRLRIVGPDNEYRAALGRLAAELNVADRIELAGPVPLVEVPRMLAEADAGIYPALPDPHMSIATPSKVLEYVVMGLPVIASRLPVLGDMFSDSAICFFEPGNASELADRIRELAQKPERGRQLVEYADTEYVRANSLSVEIARYFDVIHSIHPGHKLTIALGKGESS